MLVGQGHGSAVEAGERADDGRLGLLRVERKAVLLGHHHGPQAGQPDRCVPVGDVAASHGLEHPCERAAVDARVRVDLGAERPHGEPAKAADRPEAVRLSLCLGHRSPPIDVEREIGRTNAERLTVHVHHERHALQSSFTAVEPAYGGCRREACDVHARDLHTRRQRVGGARIDERDGHEQHRQQAYGRQAGAADQAPARLPLSAHANLR